MTPAFCPQPCETEARFLELLRADRLPAVLIRVPFTALVEPVIQSTRKAVQRCGTLSTEEDVAAGLGISEVLVCDLHDQSAWAHLTQARARGYGVIVVWDGQVQGPSDQEVLGLLGVDEH